MGEAGLVISCEERDTVTVRLTRTEACANCRACSVGMQKEDMLLHARNECGAAVGDTVEVALKEGVFGQAVLIMYAIPFAAFLLGLGVGYALGDLAGAGQEVVAFAGGVFGMLLGYGYIRKNEVRYKKKRVMPAAVAVVSKGNAP